MFCDQSVAPATEPGYLRSVDSQLHRERLGLASPTCPAVPAGDSLLFPWTGDRRLHTHAAIFTVSRMDAAVDGAAFRLLGTSRAAMMRR